MTVPPGDAELPQDRVVMPFAPYRFGCPPMTMEWEVGMSGRGTGGVSVGGPQEPGSLAENLMYVAILMFVLGALGLFGCVTVACDQATGWWDDATIAQIDPETHECTYDLGWDTAVAGCPPNPDRGQPAAIYVVTDSSNGHLRASLTEPSTWQELSPSLWASMIVLVLGAAAWIASRQVESRAAAVSAEVDKSDRHS
jgi:hypothetical protein